MATLILMRHGQAGPAARDIDRPLTAHGREQVALQAGRLAERFGTVDLALVSAAERTRQTFAGLVKGGLRVAESRALKDLYSIGPDALLALIASEAGAADTVLVVGHEPIMSWTTSLLAAPGSPGLSAGGAHFSTATFALGHLDAWGELAPGALRVDEIVAPGM